MKTRVRTQSSIVGKDGLECIREIISQAKKHLSPEGWIMLEHGYDQAENVEGLMKNAGFDSVTSVADLSGILRVTLGKGSQQK